MFDLFQYRTWALSEAYFNDTYPTLRAWLGSGHSLDALIKKVTIEDMLPRLQALIDMNDGHPPIQGEVMALARDGQTGLPVVQTKTNQNIALIPIIGPVTKYGGMCSYGMQDYQNMISAANRSEGIDGIVLMMDTPGGTVDGTPELGLTIKQSAKPIGVFGDGVVASAGVWLASQASVIVGNKNNPTQFGSIGVLMVHQNAGKLVEAGRMPNVEIIRARQSTEKALINPFEEMSDDTRTQLVDDLSDVASQFIETVKAGRGDKLNTKLPGLFAGKMFDAATARKEGLIDSVGNLQTAVNKVAELAKTAKKTNTNSNFNNQPNNQSMDILAFLGLSKEQKAQLSAEDQTKLDTLEATLTSQEQKISELEAEKVTLSDKIKGFESAATASATEIAQLKAKVTELEKEPAAPATTIVKDEDKEASEEGKKTLGEKYATGVDAELAEMKEATKQLEIK